MKRLTRQDADELLRSMNQMGSAGRAESEPEDESTFLARFLPLKEHARVLDPEIVLVIGDRGAGKTELFRAIQFPAGLEAIQSLATGVQMPDIGRSRWLVAYSTRGTEFPAELVFRQFALGRQPGDLQLIWLGLLLRCLLRGQPGFGERLSNDLRPVLEGQLARLQNLYQAIASRLEECFAALDALDKELAETGRWIFLTYDELDRVSAGDWNQLRTILRGLIQFWSSYVRRWKHIRPKLFLRRDLYDRVALFGPDVSKLAAQRVELLWTVRNLYALLLKRIVNTNRAFLDYFGKCLPPGEDAGKLGWNPAARNEAEYRPFVERMCGKYMGANPNKGQSFTWIPNHLQDGNGHVLPRSIVRLFEAAAGIELSAPRAELPRLIHHTSLRGALDDVSESRVQEIEDEEFPWMRRVRQSLAEAHPQVPLDRRELEVLLSTIEWENSAEKPPETSGRGLLQLLMELGIFYLRTDGRVDARDLYLKGFGLKRKGGVRRPY